MNFILMSKKNNCREDCIDYEFLTSPSAPSLISREAFKCEIKNFILYIYPYNHIETKILSIHIMLIGIIAMPGIILKHINLKVS